MSRSFMFFNCDENKSPESMNPMYNAEIYRTRDGMRALWRKIKEEVALGTIKIKSEDMKLVRSFILSGDADLVNNCITYGYILKLNECN